MRFSEHNTLLYVVTSCYLVNINVLCNFQILHFFVLWCTTIFREKSSYFNNFFLKKFPFFWKVTKKLINCRMFENFGSLQSVIPVRTILKILFRANWLGCIYITELRFFKSYIYTPMSQIFFNFFEKSRKSWVIGGFSKF